MLASIRRYMEETKKTFQRSTGRVAPLLAHHKFKPNEKRASSAFRLPSFRLPSFKLTLDDCSFMSAALHSILTDRCVRH
jgi:hypothetical protein